MTFIFSFIFYIWVLLYGAMVVLDPGRRFSQMIRGYLLDRRFNIYTATLED